MNLSYYFNRLLVEQAERGCEEAQLKLKKREADLRVSEDRCTVLEERVQELSRSDKVNNTVTQCGL